MSTSAESSPSGESSEERDPVVETDSPETAAAEQKPEGVSSAEGLPEIEPLSPELVEDEALRGDFMLRAFVLVLAVLLAATEIAETPTLVHVKTGQYLAAHGWLPPRADVFSFTANGRPWINLNWLFDLILAGASSIGAAKALTVLKVVIVAATFFLVTRCVKREVSTWWGSVAAALALLACHPQFTALPEVVTLLGLALVMWILYRWQAGEGNRNLLWLLVPWFILWSNLDDRMFLGLSLLALYAVGDLAGSFIGASGLVQSERRRQLWMVLAACVAAACINPFGWHALTEPLRLYGAEYPALRVNDGATVSATAVQYYPLFKLEVLQRPHVVAGLVLLSAALISLILNRKQFDPGHLFVLLGFTGFAAAASHELAAASIVACAIATLNGQEWYRESFSQAYSVEVKERLFSSGGRAATVLAMFAIAFLAASGRLKDPEGRRIGLGFHPELQATIVGLREDLADSFDKRPFNFRLDQGDLLIWLGHQPFVDSRVTLYTGTGRDDLLAIHRQTRQSLRRRREGLPFSGREEIWQAVFDRYDIVRVLPRLSGEVPDYLTLMSLQPPQWTTTRLGSMTASVYRADPEIRQRNEKLAEYLDERGLDLIEAAFQGKAPDLKSRPGWPQQSSFYERLLSSPRNERPAAVQTAMHHSMNLQQAQDRASGRLTVSLQLASAMAHLAIRHANEGLAENPDSADGYQVLGDAYRALGRLEAQLAGRDNYNDARRYRQAISAYSLAVQVDPERLSVLSRLFELYQEKQKSDLAYRSLRKFESLTEFDADESEALAAQRTQLLDMLGRLKDEVESKLQQIDLEIGKGNSDSLQIAQFAYGQGCVLRALEVLEQDPTTISERADAQLFYSVMLHEAGRIEEAADKMQRLEATANEVGLPPGWQRPAAWIWLAGGDYDRAITLWSRWNDSITSQQMRPLMASVGLTGPSLTWSSAQSQAIAGMVEAARGEMAQNHLDVALSFLELGRLEEAAESFDNLVQVDPNSAHRGLAEFYHMLLKGERVEAPPPLDRIPLDPAETFAPEEEDAEATPKESKAE